MCADKLANSMQTTADNSNLLATKAIANRFSVRHHVLHCDQFHPPTANSCHNSLSRQATHKYFNCQSLVTGNLSPKNYSQNWISHNYSQTLWQRFASNCNLFYKRSQCCNQSESVCADERNSSAMWLFLIESLA